MLYHPENGPPYGGESAYESAQLRDRHGLFILPILSSCGCLCAQSEGLRFSHRSRRQPNTISRTAAGDNESWCFVEDFDMPYV